MAVKTEGGETTTADATPVTIWSRQMGNGCAFAMVTCFIQATEFHVFTLQGVVGNAGEGQLAFSELILHTGSQGAPQMSADFVESNGNLELQVTGIAATSIKWIAEIRSIDNG